MNKYFAVGCLVVVAVASQMLSVVSADMQKASDDQEVAQLTDKNALFRDFCLATRDYISQDLQARGKSLVPSTVTDLLNDTANRHKNIRARLQSIYNNPEAELKKLDEFVVEQQRSWASRLQKQPIQASAIYGQAREAGEQARGYVRTFLKNPQAYLSKVDNFLADQQRAFGQRMQKTPIQPAAYIKNVAGSAVDGFRSMAKRISAAPRTLLVETCSVFDQYEREIQKRFEAAREQLKAQDPSVASFELKDVPCATVYRVDSVQTICADLKKDDQ